MIYPETSIELRCDEDLQWILHRLARWIRKRFLSSPAKERFSRFLPRLCRYWTREVDLTTSPGHLSAVLIHLALIASTERKCWSLTRLSRRAGTFPDWVWYYERWAFGDHFHVFLPRSRGTARAFVRAYLPDVVSLAEECTVGGRV